MMRSRLLLVLVAMPLVLGACRKKKPVEVAPQPTTQPVDRPAPVRPAETAPPTTDPNAGMAERVAAARASLLEKILFEYDADALSDAARANLDAKIRILNANPNVKIRINGHCDERGSDEYNIALGRRRAEAAKRYLGDRGIDGSRVETTTFGRERPAAQGSSEEAWAQNRRDEFEITAGGDQLRPAT